MQKMYETVNEIRYTKNKIIYFKFYIGTDIEKSSCEIITKTQKNEEKFTTSAIKANNFLQKIDYIDEQYNQKDSLLNSFLSSTKKEK